MFHLIMGHAKYYWVFSVYQKCVSNITEFEIVVPGDNDDAVIMATGHPLLHGTHNITAKM